MGLSHIKGNSGFIGIDRRGETGTTGGTGSISVRKQFLERRRGNLAPITNGDPYVLFQDDFEDGTLNKWTALNGSPSNQPSYWVVGTTQNTSYPLVSGGTYSAYITTDGTTFNYTNNSDVFIYVDVYIPADATSLTLDFDWMCNGESSYDFGYVMFTDPTLTSPTNPVPANNGNSGTYYATSYRVGPIRLNDSYKALADTEYVHETITIDSGDTYWAVGATRRLSFCFTSDGSLTYNPGFGIDNVILRYNV